jgi:two-component system osmolarity sensor histidine kinase EnvZ
MVFDWLKRLVPRGIYGRAALILVVPVVAIQLVVSIVFLQRHFDGVTRQMTESLVQAISLLTDTANSASDARAAAAAIAAPARSLGFDVSLAAPAPDAGDHRPYYDLTGRAVIETLRQLVPTLRGVDLSRDRRVTVLVDTRYGTLSVGFDRRRVSASNPHQLLVLMLATGLVMTLVAFAFLRNQLRPIRRLARAAEEFGKGRMVPYHPAGASEVRAAGNAFLDMRARIERFIDQRTAMLSGVSHDLRTPLTRLRLGLGLLDEGEEVRAMRGDLDDMQRMIDGFLDFARGEAQDSPTTETDPRRLVESVVADAQRAGQAVELGAVTGSGTARLRELSVRRALGNLIGNGARYGTRVVVGLAVMDRAVRITVEDNGPGIPRDLREEAIRPFVRLDTARNLDTGAGSGLGLAIAADVARSHGGTLRLGRSESLGGLKAELVLAR